MLKVLPIQSKNQQKEICEKCQIEYQPDLLAYAASVDDELVGICQFKMTDQGGFLYDLAKVIGRTENKECGDFEAMFVMGRGTLNFIDLCGVHRAFFCGKNPDDSLLRAIGFKKNDNDQYEINLEGFFTDHCGNHK